MPALNFQERFAYLVDGGQKRQTIRRVWKRPIKPGDTLYLYTGMRTKNCRRLGTVICQYVHPIKLDENGATTIHGLRDIATCDYLAECDGFGDWSEMRDWFKKQYGLPFEGVLIQW